MNPWIFVGLLFMTVGAVSGWWLNRATRPLDGPIGIDVDDARDNGGFDEGDDLDDVCRSVGVLCDDSRVMARWCDQPTIDRLFADMVAVHRSQVHNHTDKEN